MADPAVSESIPPQGANVYDEQPELEEQEQQDTQPEETTNGAAHHDDNTNGDAGPANEKETEPESKAAVVAEASKEEKPMLKKSTAGSATTAKTPAAKGTTAAKAGTATAAKFGGVVSSVKKVGYLVQLLSHRLILSRL